MKKRIMSLVLAAMMLVGTLISGSITQAAENSPYNDVPADHWALDDIKFATDEGLMKGTGTKIFEPETVMNRAMVVTVLYRYAGSPAVEGENKFTDVSEGAWYETPVIWASANGIVFGITENRFDPLSEIKREQLTAIIMRYAKKQAHVDTTKTENIENFEDYETIEEYAREPMAWAKANGILNGLTTTTMGPKGGATRAQFAAIIHRYDNAFGVVYNAPVYGQNYVEPEYERVEDADIYVSPNGDDSADGKTTQTAIKTFAEAKSRVRDLKDTKDGEIKVAFMAGNYGTLDGIIFELEDRGTSTQPITYCAYGDGDVVFTNGVQIPNSDFKPITSEEAKKFPESARDNIYKVELQGKIDKLPYTPVVFSGNDTCDEARYPNKTDAMDYFRNMTTRVEEEGKTPKEYDKLLMQYSLAKKVDAFTTYDGLKITGYLRTGWFQDTFPIKSYDRDTNYLTIDFENWNLDGSAYQLGDEEYPLAYEGRMADTIFFHNLAEFLDTDGEYWFDTETKTLYVYNPVGDYAIPTGGTFLYMGYGVSNVNFVGLEFNGTTGSVIEGWGENHNITIDGCTIGNVGGLSAIDFTTPANTNITVKNCEFYNFVCGGVVIKSYYRNASEVYNLESSDILITNNYFHDFGQPQYFEKNIAVYLGSTVSAEVSHNEFVNGSHGAVNYEGCIDTVIEYNVFDNMMMNTQDFGAVYTWEDITFRDNVIRYNLFTNMREHEGVHGIYFDGSYGDIVYGNLFYNVGGDNVLLNGGRDNQVYDNISITTGRSGKFITNIDHGYNYVQGTGGVPHYEALDYLQNKPEEGEAGYDKWYARWKILYEYSTDVNDFENENCALRMINTVKNNIVIGSRYFSGETFLEFSNVENNGIYGEGENPLFKDPANGDYTVMNPENFENVFPFDMVGRK